MKILALDFGTKTGYCYGHSLQTFVPGTWKLATAKEITAWRKKRLDRRCDLRIARLWTYVRIFSPDLVVFEDVEFSSYTKQIQLWSSLRAAAWIAFPSARFECVPVGTLKKFATGAGNATKEMMEASLYKQYPVTTFFKDTLDDNAVDALWIWLWARHNLSRLTSASK